MLLRLTAIALLLGMLASPGGTSPARGAELPDSARADSGRWGAWGAMPAPSDSTVLRIESSPTPGWAPLVLVPYRLVSLPFSLLRLGLEGGIRTWGRHDLPSLLGPYPLPGHLMAELEAGGLGGLGMGVDVKDVAGGQTLRLGLRAALGGSREARLGLRGGQGRARLVLSAGHARRAALAYYGLGPESSADDRSEYLQELNWGGLALELETAARVELELSATASGLAAYDREGPAFAEASAATGRSRGTAVGLRVVYDSTDQDGRPAHGGVVALKAARFFESDEGLADFTHYRASIERFVGLWNSDQTLALRAVTSWIEPEGDAPVAFTRLLAGENPDRQRGYPAGRWRDRGLALATAEYRWPVWAPSRAASLGLDALLFSDVGQVFGHLDALGDAIKTSWGGGLRLVGGGGDFSASLEIGHSDEGTRVALQFDQHFQHAKGGLFDAKRRRCATSLLLLALLALAVPAAARKPAPLADAPVAWWEDPGAPIAEPETREPHDLVDMARDGLFLPVERFFNPLRRLRDLKGDPVAPARDINSLDEALNSSWFTNRIGLFPMSPAEVALGPGPGRGPDPDGPWLVVAAKAQGVTPGFTVRDVNGTTFLVKFDPPGYLGMTSAAGAICARLFHAAGYNVPDDNVVTFTPDQLVLADDVTLKLPDGSRRAMTRADLDAILAPVERLEDGRILAIASRWVAGRPIGCFDYRGLRVDDPNDRIPHQERRELRGLRFFAAWLNHFDTKQQNSMDTWEPLPADADRGFVKHYLIDFASTLGLGAGGPEPTFGRELTVDFPAIAKRTAALGLHEDAWRRLERPAAAPGLGYWTAQDFDPWAFDPLRPNSAFADCTPRDAYWAAKIISAFTDEQLRAAVTAGRYVDPAAADIVARVLGERRDIIAKVAFDETPPLDFFSQVEGVVLWRDLGVERGIYPAAGTRYRARLATVRADRRVVEQGEWMDLAATNVALSALPGFARGKAGAPPFVALQCQVDRGEGWSRTVTCYLARGSGRVVAVDR